MEIVGPDRGFRSIANPSATEARGIRLRGDHGISRKTIAQGKPGVPAHLRSAVCILCARLRVSWAPGFPCALSFREGKRRSHHFGRNAPRDRDVVSIAAARRIGPGHEQHRAFFGPHRGPGSFVRSDGCTGRWTASRQEEKRRFFADLACLN
jgi:hypothetical protein